jgi:hypothetical protein
MVFFAINFYKASRNVFFDETRRNGRKTEINNVQNEGKNVVNYLQGKDSLKSIQAMRRKFVVLFFCTNKQEVSKMLLSHSVSHFPAHNLPAFERCRNKAFFIAGAKEKV